MISRIGDLCERIGSGGTPSRKVQEYYEGNIKWLKTKELNDSNIYDTEEHISEIAVSKSSAKMFPQDTVTMAMYGATVGKLAILKNDMTTNQACCNMVVDKEKCDYRFLYYSLLLYRNELINLANGAAQQNLNKGIIENFEIKIYPLEEQIKISNILESLDKKIELNNEMNKTLEEMAQALFKRWFVDFEFPNEEGKPYKSSGGEMVESELGMIPKGWSYGIFSDISKRIYSGGPPNTKEESYWNGLLPWMSSGETRNSFVTNTEKSITELGVEKSSTKLANKYNTVIASAGQGFTRGQTSLLLIDTYVNQSLIVIDGCEEFELFNYINIKLRYNELRAISDSHSIRGSLTTKMISALGTIIPSIEILKKYNSIIKPIIDIIENNISNTNRLIKLRDSLLPKLMSGEITVDNVEIDI